MRVFLRKRYTLNKENFKLKRNRGTGKSQNISKCLKRPK